MWQDKICELLGAQLHGNGGELRLGSCFDLFASPGVSSCNDSEENRLSPYHHRSLFILQNLQPVHWFTEGFATKDLQEAKALLQELNH